MGLRMKNKISDRLQLKQIDSYELKYKDFIHAIDINQDINVTGFYKSEIENGLFIEAEISDIIIRIMERLHNLSILWR